MPKSKIILTLGFFIALLPLLGFPHSWETFFEVVSGLGIVLLSIMISVDKRLSQKAKAERRQLRRRTELGPNEPMPDRRRRFSRRATDINPQATPPVITTPPPENDQTSNSPSES